MLPQDTKHERRKLQQCCYAAPRARGCCSWCAGVQTGDVIERPILTCRRAKLQPQLSRTKDPIRCQTNARATFKTPSTASGLHVRHKVVRERPEEEQTDDSRVGGAIRKVTVLTRGRGPAAPLKPGNSSFLSRAGFHEQQQSP